MLVRPFGPRAPSPKRLGSRSPKLQQGPGSWVCFTAQLRLLCWNRGTELCPPSRLERGRRLPHTTCLAAASGKLSKEAGASLKGGSIQPVRPRLWSLKYFYTFPSSGKVSQRLVTHTQQVKHPPCSHLRGCGTALTAQRAPRCFPATAKMSRVAQCPPMDEGTGAGHCF